MYFKMRYYVFEMVMPTWSLLLPSIVSITLMPLNHKIGFGKIVKKMPELIFIKTFP